ncbi:hypothetical protein PDO_3842 [Rhizobium sp. PDO1-076]|nr:hypothetical protein PDO_3842 [Rhizobium sp. PDO1-076]
MSQQERMFVFFKGLKLFRPQKEGIGNMSFKSLAEAIRMASQPLLASSSCFLPPWLLKRILLRSPATSRSS